MGMAGMGAPMRDDRAAVIVISGAAGQIAYSLLPLICSGSVFGDQRVSLRLLDIPRSMEVLRGVVMELEDAAYPLLEDIYLTAEHEHAFTGADYVILLGGFPRLAGMERRCCSRAAPESRHAATCARACGRSQGAFGEQEIGGISV